ncbi:hypothetical protein JCM3766R1_005821, partial [Sporobolomyces carnicolor]
MSYSDDGDAETQHLLTLLTGSIDQASFPPSGSTSASASAASRPFNYSSAFSQAPRSRDERRPSGLATATTGDLDAAPESFNPERLPFPLADAADLGDFAHFGFGDQRELEDEEVALAGPGPRSIAAAVARNAIHGIESFDNAGELPIPPANVAPAT